MEIDIDIKNVEDFVLSDNFRNFLMSKTTSFATAAFVLQTLLEKIEEIKKSMTKDQTCGRNYDKEGQWEINPDSYYPQCPFCGEEPTGGIITERCLRCGARLEIINEL